MTTRHGRRQETFVVDSTSSARYNYIGWLRDCFVGVTPLESGFRVALVYDIVRKVPSPPSSSPHDISDLQRILQYWASNPQSTPKQLVYYLEDPFEVISGVEEIPPMALSQMSFIHRAGEPLGFQSKIACLTYAVRGRASEKEASTQPGDLLHAELEDLRDEWMQLEDLRGPDGLPSSFCGLTKLQMAPEELLEYSPRELFDGETEKPEEARQVVVESVLVSDQIKLYIRYVQLLIGYSMDVHKACRERQVVELAIDGTATHSMPFTLVFRCNVLVILPPNRHP